jgi:hypothetical protein
MPAHPSNSNCFLEHLLAPLLDCSTFDFAVMESVEAFQTSLPSMQRWPSARSGCLSVMLRHIPITLGLRPRRPRPARYDTSLTLIRSAKATRHFVCLGVWVDLRRP